MPKGSTALKLTPQQNALLLSYVDDICHDENEDLRRATKDVFVERATNMDFDGQCSRGDVLVTMNLAEKGVFSAVDAHNDRSGHPCIYVVFSPVGAAALYELMSASNGLEQVAPPRLGEPA